jgi:hypothetical protein
MLSPYRALDLSDHRDGPAGYILGSLGAEVVVVDGVDELMGLVSTADVRIESPDLGQGWP